MTDDLTEQIRALKIDEVAEAAVGPHPDPLRLAAWLDEPSSRGTLTEHDRARIESHLASCFECRALVLDVSAGWDAAAVDAAALDIAGSVTAAQNPIGASDLRRFRNRRKVTGFLAVAAGILFALVSFRLLSVDPRLGELGVGPWHRLTADRELLQGASELLRGNAPGAVEASRFGSFAPDPKVIRGASAAPVLLSPRWEAVIRNEVVWVWRSELEPVELLVIDEQERLVLRSPLDPQRLKVDGSHYTYGPIPELGAFDPNLVYAWKLNVRDADGGSWASDFVPFRQLSPSDVESLTVGFPPLLSAVSLIRAGAYTEALGQLAEVPGSDEQYEEWIRFVLERQRVPPSAIDLELERRSLR